MKKILARTLAVIFSIIFTLLSLNLRPFQNLKIITVYADDYEYAWFPVDTVNLTQLSFESYSHSYSYHFDCKGGNYAFAPFTGKVVYIDKSWGLVGLQSTNKVHWADGSLAYMTVWFMHGLNAGSFTKGQIISQGTSFYQMGGTGYGNPNYYGYHYDIGVSRGQINTPTDQSGHGVGNYCGCGSDYPYNAFFLNRSKTPTIVNPGKLQGRFVGGTNNKSNWSGLWKDLDEPSPTPYMTISEETKPTGILTPGNFFPIKGKISAYPNIEAVYGGVAYRNGGGYVDNFYCQDFPNSSSYDLSKKFDNELIFNNLPVGYYTYYIYGRDVEKREYELIKSDFQIENPTQNYTVTLDANGGTPSSTITVQTDGTYSGLTNPARTGYSFDGWYTSVSGGTKVSNGDKIVSNSAHTLYAHWTANQYTVSFDTDGIASKTVTYDQSYGSFDNPSRTGYTFVGWFTASDGGSQIEPDTAVKITSDQKLYAQWKPNQYTVSLNANGGTVSLENITVTYDSTYSGLPDAEKTGYHFNGWFTSTDGGTQISPNDKVLTTGKQTLYAHWSKDTMMITFDARGGISEGGTKLVRYDSKYGVLPNAERTGYTFEGWYLDENYANQIMPDTVVQITANQSVYAKWTLKKYTVTFDANGGAVETVSKQVTYGKKYGVLPQAEKANDTFVGWFTEDGTEITSSEIVKLENDTIFYAKWQSEIKIVGDINLDGILDIKDIKLLLSYLHGKERFTADNFYAADILEDGKINIFDLISLKKILLERNSG